MSKLQNEEHFLAYLDVLGFKEVLGKSPDMVEAYYDTLRVVRNFADKGLKTSTLGDAIVLSLQVGEAQQQLHNLHLLLSQVAIMQCRLAASNIWTRGAVTRGQVNFADDGFFVGQALAKAYVLETSIAKYPRVIVDPEILSAPEMEESGIYAPGDLISKLNGHTWTKEWEEHVVFQWDESPVGTLESLSPAATLQKDVPLFVDYLAPYRRYEHRQRLGNLVSILEERMRSSIEHYPKYAWVASYLKAIVMSNPVVQALQDNGVARLFRL